MTASESAAEKLERMKSANENHEWWKVHTAGQHVRYGDWHIEYNPLPIPFRNCDWQFWHDSFDDAEDACDNRHGTETSLIAAMDAIDDIADEHDDAPDVADRRIINATARFVVDSSQ